MPDRFISLNLVSLDQISWFYIGTFDSGALTVSNNKHMPTGCHMVILRSVINVHFFFGQIIPQMAWSSTKWTEMLATSIKTVLGTK